MNRYGTPFEIYLGRFVGRLNSAFHTLLSHLRHLHKHYISFRVNLNQSVTMGAVVSCIQGMLQAIGRGIMAVISGIGASEFSQLPNTGLLNANKFSHHGHCQRHRQLLRRTDLLPHLRPRRRRTAEENAHDKSSIVRGSLTQSKHGLRSTRG